MSDSERIIKLKNFLKISYNRIAEEIQLNTSQTLYDIKNGKHGISKEVADKISARYLNINKAWLLTGEGEMILQGEENVQNLGRPRSTFKEALTNVRFFAVTPTATFQEFCTGISEAPETIEILKFEGDILDESACVFEVSGNSMAPQIQSGAYILCNEVPPTKWHTLRRCVVVIAYGDKFVIKRIIGNYLDCENYIILGSDNPDYPGTCEVCLSDIRCIFKAVRIITQSIN